MSSSAGAGCRRAGAPSSRRSTRPPAPRSAPRCSPAPADIDAAVAAARESFDAGVWAGRPAAERAAVLRGAADHLEQLGADAVDLLTRELGCPRWFSERAHVPNPIRHLRYYADLIETRTREETARRRDQPQPGRPRAGRRRRRDHAVERPAQRARASRSAPALAAGCSVVLKPPPETPLTAYLLADALSRGRAARGRAEHAAGRPGGRRAPGAASARWTRSRSPAAPRPGGRSWRLCAERSPG